MSHDMTKVHSKDCQCVRCEYLERPCCCDHCRAYSFKRELKALLEKYNASISFEVGPGSDTHGLYDEEIMVHLTSTTPGKLITHFGLSKGWDVNKNDL